jgi:hypothetical protein
LAVVPYPAEETLPVIVKLLDLAAASTLTYAPEVGLVVVTAPLAASIHVSPEGRAVLLIAGVTFAVQVTVTPTFTASKVREPLIEFPFFVPNVSLIYPAVTTLGAAIVPVAVYVKV